VTQPVHTLNVTRCKFRA